MRRCSFEFACERHLIRINSCRQEPTGVGELMLTGFCADIVAGGGNLQWQRMAELFLLTKSTANS